MWFHSQGYSSTAACQYAARTGNIDLLNWLRSQDSPWPWGIAVTAQAWNQPEALRWLLTQQPPCPLALADAANWGGSFARLGDLALMEHLSLPIQDMPELCVSAACHGNLALLKWLVQQRPPCPLSPRIFWTAATRRHTDVMHFLINEHVPPAFPRSSRVASYECSRWYPSETFAMLAQAGCTMRVADRDAVKVFTESWIFMSFWHWAVRHGQLTVISISSHNIPGHQQHEQAPSSLLMQLARLPYELVETITSEAFLSPQQAAQIHFRSDSSRSSGHSNIDVEWYTDLDEDEGSFSSSCSSDVNGDVSDDGGPLSDQD